MAFDVILNSKLKKVLTGFDHATQTSDTTFSIYFIDGTHLEFGIPAPSNGVSVVEAYLNSDEKLVFKLSNGFETTPITIPTGTKNYNDLLNIPKINNVELKGSITSDDLGLFDGDYEKLTNKPTLFSGSYLDLSGKPELLNKTKMETLI